MDHDLGYCQECGAPIILTAEEVRDRQKFYRNNLGPITLDKPAFGTERIIPMPPYPCGHTFKFVQKCRKAGNQFVYDF